MNIPAAEFHGLCQVMYRVAIHIRSFAEIERQVVWGLMEATHNIPLYLQNGNPELADQVRWDIDNFDQRFADRPLSLKLREIYDEAIVSFNR